MNEFILTLKKTFDYSSRATRKEYWIFAVFFFAVAKGFPFIAKTFFSDSTTLSSFFLFFPFILLFPMFSLGARRLHDVGKSGWLQLVIATGFGAFYILYLAIVPGDDGENMYGAPSTNTETDIAVATQVIATNTQTEYATAPTTTTENTVAETMQETPGILPSQNTETVATIENTNQI